MSSIVEQIRILEELASMDAALKVLSEALNEERSTLSKLTGSVAQLEARSEQEKASRAATERARAECLIEVRNMNQQI